LGAFRQRVAYRWVRLYQTIVVVIVVVVDGVLRVQAGGLLVEDEAELPTYIILSWV
jgi:hypothetical protein